MGESLKTYRQPTPSKWIEEIFAALAVFAVPAFILFVGVLWE